MSWMQGRWRLDDDGGGGGIKCWLGLWMIWHQGAAETAKRQQQLPILILPAVRQRGPVCVGRAGVGFSA